VVVAVSDDGVGMDAEDLAALRESVRDQELYRTEHIGLRNLNARLELAYGSSLDLESAAGGGTRVSFAVPKGN
jgi:two-component system sensor histidine kinase YesM